ncbi:MAG: hypothetical protein JOZ54_13090, partial [Acidobacteria bacterium]|nr:hypothetical protein [Acidobacteriota bacterium]
FALTVAIDRNASTVTLHAPKPLPFQLRRKREQDAAKLLAGSNESSSLPLLPNPYALFDVPFVDARLRTTNGRNAASLNYDLFATGDLAGLTATTYLSGTGTNPLATSWLTLGRRDPEPILLGPLHAREAAAGEVFFPGNDLVAAPKRGIGAAISSFPVERSSRFDEQTISGELHPGEDVELYVNDALAGYARGSESTGHYTFAGVPVRYGLNVFRLVFYDTHGRQRVETRTFNAGDTLTRKGRFDYRVVAASRHLAEVAYGMTGNMTVTGAVTSVEQRNYLSGGLRATFGRVFGYADLARDLRGGTIARLGLQTRIGPIALSAAHAQLDGFVSEMYSDDRGPIASRTSIQASGSLGRLDATIEQLVSGARITHLGGMVSASRGRLLIANGWQAALGVPGSADSASGTLRFSRSSGALILRGELEYGIHPRRDLTSARVAADWRQFRATIDTDLATRLSRATATVRHDAGRYELAVTAEVPSRGGPVLRVEVATSVLHNPLARRWGFHSKASASAGAVAAMVFLDNNDNGIRDDGEPPIAGAGFVVNRNPTPIVTNLEGIAFLDNLPPDRRSEIGLSPATLEDPGWLPATTKTAFVARAGKPLVVNFPVVVTGEISGVVSRGRKIASAVRVELLHADGTVAAETFSAYDGFYLFGEVKPGAYTVRIGTASRALMLSAEEHLFDHIDFALEPQG